MNRNSDSDTGKEASSSHVRPPARPAGAALKANPDDTAQEAVHQVMPKSAAKALLKPEPANDTPPPPMRAARGDDDLMSKPQQQAVPGSDAINSQWQQQLGAAKIAWAKLTDDELLKSQGHEATLAGLIQERYATSRDEADKRVKHFFARH